MQKADELQEKTLLYPMDACIYAAAYDGLMPESSDLPYPAGFLVTFDSELLDQMQVLTPESEISIAEAEEVHRKQRDENQSGG